MAEIDSCNDSTGNPEFGMLDMSALSSSLRHSATRAHIAPTSFNGCISEVSSDAVRHRKRDHTAAMKSYGVVYEEYQAYLMPMEQAVSHDYDLATKQIADFSRAGCLTTDFLDSTMRENAVSDDDIESCGYMAWVKH